MVVVGEVAGGAGVFYRARDGRGGGWSGAWLTAINGAVSSGGGNGEGKQGAGEVKGAVPTIHFATGGEGMLCGGGKQAAAVVAWPSAGGRRRGSGPRLG
jgi:hypothetical protein